MGEAFRGPGGGLPAGARALLTPGNIRKGIHIKGGGVDVVGNIIPYTIPSNKIIGMLCFAQSGWYCCETPYFAWNGSNGLVCKIACRATATINGKAEHGNTNVAYADVYINGTRVIHDDSKGWDFNGSVTYDFALGATITAGFSGDAMGDKKHLKLAVAL